MKTFTKSRIYEKNNRAITPNGLLFQFEIMTQSRDEAKVALAFQRMLSGLAIHAEIRTVDDSQYQNRLEMFDYSKIKKLSLQEANK